MRPGEVGAVRFDRERDPDLDPDLDPDPHPDLEPDRVPRGAAGGAAITNRRSPGNMQSGARIFGPAPAVDAGAPPPSVLVQMDEKAEQVDALFAKADKAVKEENWDDCFGTMDKILRLDPTATERMRPIYKACGDGITGVMAKAGRDGGRAVKKRDAGRPVRDAGPTGGDSGR